MGLEFCHVAVQTLAIFGIKSYVFSDIAPTPELSFAIRELKADGGIMITASHNDARYNGFKIYDNEGCQCVPSIASVVMKNIEEVEDIFGIKESSFEGACDSEMVEVLGTYIDKIYLDKIKQLAITHKSKYEVKVVFTPLHGTTAKLGPILLKDSGCKVIKVKEQMIPDPSFSTVTYPNPESKEAFSLALKYAHENDADVIIATDPDGDRIGVAIKDEDDYVMLSGNELADIFIYYLSSFPQNQTDVILSTIVSSALGKAIAKKHEMDYFEVYTGFKYIGQQMARLREMHRKFLFGYEESYGYSFGDFARDKDSLQAMYMLVSVIQYYKSQNMNLLDVLTNISHEFGYYENKTINITKAGEAGANTINSIMKTFRKMKISEIGTMKISNTTDYMNQDLIINEVNLGKSDVLKYEFSDGGFVALRPSGTEPKIKIYIETVGKVKLEALEKYNIVADYFMNIVGEK